MSVPVLIQAPVAGSSSSSSVAAAGSSDEDESVMELELEMDELNQHECMSRLISLLRHMQLNAITPAVLQVTAHLYCSLT